MLLRLAREGGDRDRGHRLMMIKRTRDRAESSPGAKTKHLNSQRLRQTQLSTLEQRLEVITGTPKHDNEQYEYP